MAVTPVTALSETCLGVTTTTTCHHQAPPTPLPPVSALCASLRAKAVIAEYTVCGMQGQYAAGHAAAICTSKLGNPGKVHTANQLLQCASTLSGSLLATPCLLNLPTHLDQLV